MRERLQPFDIQQIHAHRRLLPRSTRPGHCSIAGTALVSRSKSGTTPCEAMTNPPPAPSTPDPVRWLNNQPYLLLSLTSLFWAGNIVLARHVGDHVPPITLTTIRWFCNFL